MTSLTRYVSENAESSFHRMGFVLEGMVEELADELADMPPDMLEKYFELVGSVLTWIGNGSVDALPEELRPFATSMGFFGAVVQPMELPPAPNGEMSA